MDKDEDMIQIEEKKIEKLPKRKKKGMMILLIKRSLKNKMSPQNNMFIMMIMMI